VQFRETATPLMHCCPNCTMSVFIASHYCTISTSTAETDAS